MLVALLALPAIAWASTVLNTVPGTSVLLSQSGSGPLSSTSSNTNIFSPAAYVDYKRFGNEPTVTVDRYPFAAGTTTAGFRCAGTAPCYRDEAYVSGPNGFVYPSYSPFFKSDDLGQSFRVPPHAPVQGQPIGAGRGGGDSHTAVGQITHRLFFTDLPGPGCVTMNISDDMGEHFVGDNLGCGTSPGVIDDRNWVEADETASMRNVYLSFINFSNIAAPTLALARSTHDGDPGSFATDPNPCNLLSSQVPAPTIAPLADSTPTACPDPADVNLQIGGPVVADKTGTSTRPPTHNLYIPFIRGTAIIPGLTAGPPYSLWVARSTDQGLTWTRSLIAQLGDHNPANIFPDLVVDRGGNLYVTWSQTQGPALDSGGSGLLGETDVYYSYSTNAGAAWAPPIDLTQSSGKSAVMPWLVAGDPGLVDIVYYQSNTGLNPNVATVDANGNACNPNDASSTACSNPNPSVWNVMFGQSNNALNPGANFSNGQITDHPNHIGQICTAGLACSGDRDLGDFFTIDVDHLGAANVSWVDDNSGNQSDGRNKFSRQLSGSSVFKNTTIGLHNSWPITDHAVTDPSGDTTNAPGARNGSCLGMDVLGTSASRSGELITVSLTLNATPDFAKAVTCSGGTVATGGLWGAEFWASGVFSLTGAYAPQNFYIGYRDNPPDGPGRVEAGRLDRTNVALTSLEFHPTTAGSPSAPAGTCFSTRPPSPCTITMTVNATSLGVKSGAGLYSITGLSTYIAGTQQNPVVLRTELGNSEQADAATAFDYNGTGTTTK